MTGLCTVNQNDPGRAVFGYTPAANALAGAEFAQRLTDGERKGAAYNELKAKYGAVLAGAPDAALKAQEYFQRQQNPIAVQQMQAELLAQQQRNAELAARNTAASAAPVAPPPVCTDQQAALARWAKEHGYQLHSACQ